MSPSKTEVKPINGKRKPANGNTKRAEATSGMGCNIKELYMVRDQWGDVAWSEKQPVIREPVENEVTARNALIVRKEKSSSPRKKFSVHSIIVQSPLLKEALSVVLCEYPGITTSLNRLTFEAPFEPFIHRWEEFNNALSTLEGEAQAHFELLYRVLKEELHETILAKEDFIANKVITFDFVWAIFQPGGVIYYVRDGRDCAAKFTKGRYAKSNNGATHYSLECQHVAWDGTKFGYANTTLLIDDYDGTKKITDLSCIPMEYHRQAEEITQSIIERGRLFEAYRGFHYKAYKGIALSQGNRINIDSRIIIDRQAHGENNPNFHGNTRPLSNRIPGITDKQLSKYDDSAVFSVHDGPSCNLKSSNGEEILLHRPLTSEEHLICKSTVFGYALKAKRWLEFFVDKITPIKFNDAAFQSLVLPADQKELILAFAESHISSKDSFDDVISGKGKGIIMLLSGGPGIGKTLTAESVAENMRVPLFMMSAGDLGSESEDIEEKLSKILEMVAKWNAVLLLDECDVFLEARSPHDMERNKVVSIFLRTLEYYEGILFLTTNRVDNIDSAFQSRIHITLEYPPLDLDSRKTVWNNFLARMDGGSELTEEEIARLATVDLNGRQIKNILKAAQLLALRAKVKLGLSHLKTVLNVERGGAAADI